MRSDPIITITCDKCGNDKEIEIHKGHWSNPYPVDDRTEEWIRENKWKEAEDEDGDSIDLCRACAVKQSKDKV